MRLILFLMCCLSTLANANPKNIALQIGGTHGFGKNIFDEDFRKAQLSLRKSGFHDYRRLYNGSLIGSATIDNARFALNRITKENLPPGSQVMLIINAHGSKVKTKDVHCVGLENNVCWPLSELEQFRDTLHSKGVKLAIVDFSCHSGSTLNLKNNNTCVMTAANEDDVSYAPFSAAFFKELHNGSATNAEELFLKTKTNDAVSHGPSYSARISTPLGLEMNKLEDQFRLNRSNINKIYLNNLFPDFPDNSEVENADWKCNLPKDPYKDITHWVKQVATMDVEEPSEETRLDLEAAIAEADNLAQELSAKILQAKTQNFKYMGITVDYKTIALSKKQLESVIFAEYRAIDILRDSNSIESNKKKEQMEQHHKNISNLRQKLLFKHEDQPQLEKKYPILGEIRQLHTKLQRKRSYVKELHYVTGRALAQSYVRHYKALAPTLPKNACSEFKFARNK